MDIKNVSIDNIGLTNRSLNALHRIGVQTVGEMLGFTRDSLCKVRNLGSKSVDEIMDKITEYKNCSTQGTIGNFDAWLNEKEGMDFVRAYLRDKKVRLEELETLPTRAFNLLRINGYESVDQIVFLDKEQLNEIPRMDRLSLNDIMKAADDYIWEHKEELLQAHSESVKKNGFKIDTFICEPAYHDKVLEYVSANDQKIADMSLSNRPKNQLAKNGFSLLSEIIFKTEEDFLQMDAMGEKSAKDIMEKIHDYLSANEHRITALCMGNEDALWDDIAIKDMILKLYQDAPFNGFSLKEMLEKMDLPADFSQERIKKIIGSLIADHKLEYVDFRCYRIYETFEAFLSQCDAIDERSKDMMQLRLDGETLETIGQKYNLTRERIRQIIKKKMGDVRSCSIALNGDQWFDEDYYYYFYTNYEFDRREVSQWMGISESVWKYLDMMDAKQGKKDLLAALDDHENLEIGLRLKVKNYLNRNKIFIDGMWVEKKRSELEPVIARKFCQEDTSFELYAKAYNDFLIEEEIPFDEDIYYTDAVIRTRKNRLVESRLILWKMNEMLRYYDIDSRDYTELLETLNLDSFENVEYSTMKFMREYPKLMEKYDIRDHYELHNLLRKIVPEGSFHDFRCGRMPEIKFGTFDRDAAILDILIDLAPVSVQDLSEHISQEYGYDPAVIAANYLQSFQMYYHEGIYSIDQKVMLADRAEALHSKLTDDFYYIDEIRRIYANMYPDADLEEINPYNLKAMGFIVLSRYVVQNYPSLEAYCEDILTREDIVDLKSIRRRLTYVQIFSNKLMELKKSLNVIEFEPGKLLNFRKLEKAGITKKELQDFCDAVYDFVTAGSYFNICSIKQGGFESELFDLGFSDWFYANILISDERFSFTTVFGNIVLYKGKKDITIQSFLIERICSHGWIDVYDLMTELAERYDCKVDEKSDITYRLKNTIVYHDNILERLYANADLYYQDLEAGGF